MTHRHYQRSWSPTWGHRRDACTCGHDDPDEALYTLVAALLGLAAAVIALAAAVLRRPLLAAVIAVTVAVAGVVGLVVWAW
jgi:hypothetical protein